MAKHISVSYKKENTKKVFQKKTQGVFPKELPKEPKNPFDFGGLPMRDFKTNLGCG